MSARDPYITSSDPNLHLRDARHAHQFFTEHGHQFAPKTKFLYHIVFQTTDEVSNSSNSVKFQKEIGVLAKSVELPQFRASVENKQQYNRKKNIQTRIDYQDINIRFYDDNAGVTRAMLEEYYRFYVSDSRYTEADNAYGSRNKYESSTLFKHGLDNNKDKMFFSYIKIFQLSKQKWYSYTLLNPIITQWGHDTLDNTDNSGMMENVMSVAYEAVSYNNGDIVSDTPPGFTSPETRYDVVDSPLDNPPNSGIINETRAPSLNSTVDTSLVPRSQSNVLGINTTRDNTTLRSVVQQVITQSPVGSILPEYEIPESLSNLVSGNVLPDPVSRDPDALLQAIETTPAVKQSFIARALNTNTLEGISYSTYLQSDASVKKDIENSLAFSIANGSRAVSSIAQDAINSTRNN